MTTKKASTKQIKIKQIATDGPRFFAPIKHSRNSPPSLTGWADDSKSSFAMAHSIEEKRVPTEKDLETALKPVPTNEKNIVAILTGSKVYEKAEVIPYAPKRVVPALLTKQAKLGYDFQTKLDPASYDSGHEVMRPRRPASNAQTSRDLLVPSYPKLLMENVQREETILSVKRFKGRVQELTASVPVQTKVIKEVSILPLSKENNRSKATPIKQIYSHREVEKDSFRSRDSSACSSPRPFTSLLKKKRVPTGCFKAMDLGSKNSFSRKTYMGISRLTAGRGSLGESVLGNINGDSLTEDKNLVNKSGNNFQTAVLTSRRESKMEERQRTMTAAVIAKRGSIASNYNTRNSSGIYLDPIGSEVDKQLKSMIQMPANIGKIQSFTSESPNAVKINLLEKLKMKLKNQEKKDQQQYRPKGFLKSFKPKAKDFVTVNTNGDLIIQPLRNEYNNTSLLIGERIYS